jgi:F-box interacting protein
MDGNVVRRMEGLYAPRMSCTSLDRLACFAHRRSPDPEVVDLATGEMLLTRPMLDGRPRRRPLDTYRTYAFGFGRTAVSQVYKVVRLVGTRGSFFQCRVLTLGDGVVGWREAQPPTTHLSEKDHKTPVAIDGVLHFLVPDRNIVVCFDLESEEWSKTIKCPGQGTTDNFLFEKTSKTIIAELNGALCIARTDLFRDMYYSCTDIWLLKDNGKDIWSNVYTIRMGATVDLLKPLRIMGDCAKLLFCYIHNGTSEPVLQVYDPRANTCKEVMVATDLTDVMGLCNLRLDYFI